MTPSPTRSPDGRRARRDRNRDAVIDAVLELLAEDPRPPTPQDVAARAGVSVASLFRYFDGLDDMARQAVERHVERHGPLFGIPAIGEGALDDRIDRFVDARVTLYETVEPVARLARARASEHPAIAERLVEVRARFRRQIRRHFAPELDGLARPRVDEIVDLVDSLTAFESWDLLRSGARRSNDRIRRTWVTGLGALLAPLDPD